MLTLLAAEGFVQYVGRDRRSGLTADKSAAERTLRPQGLNNGRSPAGKTCLHSSEIEIILEKTT